MRQLFLYLSSTLILILAVGRNPIAPIGTIVSSEMMCDPDFDFTVQNCSQTVSFQATTPTPITNPDFTFEWDFGDGSSPTTGTTVQHTYNALGGGTTSFPVSLTVTNVADGCTSSTQATITIDELPDASLTDQNIFSPFAYCDGDSYTLEVENTSATASENVSYQINWGDGSSSFMAGPDFTTTSHPYSGQGSYLIELVVTGANGCTNTFTQEFYLGGNPAVGISIPPLNSICDSTEVTVNIENWEDNSPGTRYIVTSNSSTEPLFTFIHPPPPTFDITFPISSCGFTSINNSADAFHVILEAINPCGNSSATVEPIRVSSPPTAAMTTSPPPTACPDQAFEFCDVSFGANFYIPSLGQCTEEVERSWSIMPTTYSLLGGTLEDECLEVSFDAPGTYEICLEINNPCEADVICETVIIAETPIAAAQFDPPNDNCAPQTVTFENESQHQIFSDWSITPLNGWTGDLMVDSPTITFSAAGTYTVRLVIENPCGTDIWETTLEIDDVPTVNLSPISDLCEGEQITASAEVVENGCTTTYAWFFPGGNPASHEGLVPPPITYEVAGQYEATLSVINCCGTTTVSQSFNVTGTTSGTVTAAVVNNDACIPATVNLTGEVQNVTSGGWTITPASGWSGNLDNTDPSISINELGSYIFTYVGQGGCGSIEWDTTIAFQDLASVMIDFDDSICIRESISPTLTAEENGCATTYEWTFSGGNPSSHSGPNPPTIFYATVGEYEVTLEATNCCGTTTASSMVNVTGLTTANPTTSVVNDNTCVPTTISLMSQAQNVTSGGWTITPSSGWSGDLGMADPSVIIETWGSYTFAYAAQGGCGSIEWDTTITFQDLASVIINFDDSICTGESISPTLTAEENGCATTYEWTFSGGNPSSHSGPNPPTIFYATVGEYEVILEATNCCGTTTASSMVNVTGLTTANPTASVANDNTCVPTTVSLMSQAQNITSGGWTITPSSGWSGDLGMADPSVIIETWGSYTFAYAAQGACGMIEWDTTIHFQDIPFVNINLESSICVGEFITPTIEILENGCTVSDTDIIWSFPDGIPNTFTGFTPPPIIYNVGGENTFTVSVTNCCGTTTESQTVMVEDFVDITVPDTIESCINDPCILLTGNPASCLWSYNGETVPNNEFCPPSIGRFELVYTCGSANCPSFDTTIVIVHDLPPIVDMPIPITVCDNDNPLALTASPDNENTWWTGNGIDSLGIFDPSLPDAGGIMIYHHFNPLTGCINTAEVAIMVNTPTTLTIMNATFCAASTINLETEFGIVETPGESVTWSGSGITNPDIGIFELPANSSLPTDFTIHYTLSNGLNCNYADSVVITIVPLESADAGVDTTLCGVGSYQLLGNFGVDDASWSANSALAVTNTGLLDLESPVIPVGETPFTFTYTAFAGTTCEVTDQVTVTIINLAAANAGSDLYFCATQAIDTLSPGTLPMGNIGVWEGPGIMDSLLGIIDLTVIPPDSNITVSYTVYSSTLSACSTTDDITIYAISPPIIDFSYSTHPCLDIPIFFNNQTIAAGEYHWDFGDGTTSDEILPNHTYDSSGTYTITLEAWSFNPLTNDLLCTSIDSQIIIIPPVPEIDLAVTSFDGCDSTILYFDGTSVSGGGDFELSVGPQTYSNQIPDSIAIPQTMDTFEVLVVVAVADDCYPLSVDTSLVIPPAFNARFELQDFNDQSFVFCPPYEANFTNLSTGTIDSFVVDYGNGQLSTNGFISVIYDNTTDTVITYQINLVVFNTLCSPDTATLELMIFPYLFEADLQTLQLSACQNEPTNFIAQVSSWIDTVIFNPGNGLGSFPVMAGDTISYTYSASGSFETSLFATNGCGDIVDTSPITILASPELDLIMDTQVCIGQEIFVSLTSDAPIVGAEITFPDTTISNLLTSYTPRTSGVINVSAIALDSTSLCPSTTTELLNVIDYSGEPIDVQVDNYCNEAQIRLNSPVDYLIVDQERILESEGRDSLVVSFTEAGVHFIEFIQIDAQGCESNQIVSFETTDNIITIDAGRDTTIFLGDIIQLEGSIGNGIPPYAIEWVASDRENNALDTPYERSTTMQPKTAGFYTLIVRDANGCQAFDEVYVDVIVPEPVCNGDGKNHIYVPNAFSPNKLDGINDRFHVYAGSSVAEIKSFNVYNRWGGLVFQRKEFVPTTPPSTNDGWDGNLRGQEMVPKVFVWYVEYRLINGDWQVCKGDVVLIRY